MKLIYNLLVTLFLLVSPQCIWAQINIANTSAVTENFDAMGVLPIASLPASWKISSAGTVTPSWSDAGNFTATLFAANIGIPITGGRYNWGKILGTDRAVGFISSQSYKSPNSIMAWYRNTGSDAISALTISYDLFQFRINDSLPIVTFYYSTDGSTWNHITAGDAQQITTGSNAYNFSNPANFGRSAAAGTSAFTIKSLNVPVNSDIYLRWEVKTIGSSASEGVGLDNVSVSATFGAPVVQNTISDTNPLQENFDEIGGSGNALLPSNWKMSPAGTISPTWDDASNFVATNFAASSGTPVTGGRYNWGRTGDTDRAVGFISSQLYSSPNSIMAWYKNTGTDIISKLSVSYDLFQFRINDSLPIVTFYYSTDGSTWVHVASGDAQKLATGSSAYNFSNPANFGRSVGAGTSAFTIKGVNVPVNGDIYLRWEVKTIGSSASEGVGLDNVSVSATFGVPVVKNTISDTNPLQENFDEIGASGNALLPSNWKMSPAGTISPIWSDANNYLATNFAASSGTPVTGGRYNWGKTGDTDRAVGFISSQAYSSPSSIMAWYKNTGSDIINTLTISYDLFQFRINDSLPIVGFYYSTDGSTWTHVTSGDAQKITTGSSAYNFSAPANFGRSASAGTSAFTIRGLNVPVNGDVYLRWEVKTIGSSISEGLGLDNVSVSATFGLPVVQNIISDDNSLKENFDEIGASADALLPSNWRMSPPGTLSPTWNDANNFLTTNFAASSGSPITGGRYNWGKTGDTDRAVGFISSQTYLSQNSIMAWYKNGGTQNLITLIVSYDLFQFRINTAQPVVNFYYSKDGITWVAASGGDAQTISVGESAYNFSNPANFGNSSAAGNSSFKVQGLNIPPGGDIYLRWTIKTVGSSSSEGLGLDNVEIKPEFGEFGAALTRGPYLNIATQSGIVIRWRTNEACNSKVNFGTSPDNLINSVVDTTTTKEHIVQLNGLSPNTQYYYAIGYSDQILQGDVNNYFKTLPTAGSNQKVRILAMGDMGTGSNTQKGVRNAYLNYNGSNYTDIWMLLGDNAYLNGLDSEYQDNFFNIYQDNLTKNHVLWPAPGNHDYGNDVARAEDHQVPYYDIFSVPTNGEAGGVPSHSKSYYSYNYGNIHFVSLDSYGSETSATALFDTTSAQAEWLKQDLEANTQKWTVVYFHHPPYSKGGSNSDTDPIDFRIRNKIVPVLERYKVDLVVNGHSHDYERTFLINGHYGLENTFDTATMAISNSSAKYDGSSNSAPYIKNPNDPRNGIVYALTGSAGQIGGTSEGYPHNAMEYSNVTDGGLMILEIEDNRLDAKWLCRDGVIRDNFTMMKDVNKIVDTTTSYKSAITLTASWIGDYMWSNGATTRSITINPTKDTSLTVQDGLGYLKDSFHIVVTGQLAASATANIINCKGGTATVTVNATGGAEPYDGTGSFTVSAGTYDYIVTDADGNKDTASITVTEPDSLIASLSADSILCNGSTTIVTVNAIGGTAPYTGLGNFTVGAGTYNYIVTDSNGCASNASITLSQPGLLNAGAASGVIKCNGGTTSVTVSGTGGTAPYTGNGNFTVTAGTYNYTVKDANGCTAKTSITVNQPSALKLNANVGKINCNGGTTTVTINGTGGTAPYAGEGSFTVGAGTYHYSITDANGCSVDTSITLNASTTLKANAVAGAINCNGGNTTITVSATGGAAPYTGTGNFTVNAGTYNYTIKDANQCSASTSITVNQPEALKASSTAGTISCYGSTTTVTVSAIGGTAPYRGTGNFTVTAGTYTYTVTDAKGCSNSTTITVTQPAAALKASATAPSIVCYGGTTTVTVSATGGSAPYTGTGKFTVIAGTYNYTVKDAKGCTSIASITVTQAAVSLKASSTSGTINCNGGTTTVTVSGTGGVTPYTGTGNFIVPVGSYTYTVKDAKGCTANTSITVSQPAALKATATAGTMSCWSNTTTVTVSASGGTAPYTGTGIFTVYPGTYTYTVKDAKGCTNSTTITVTKPTPMSITTNGTAITCYGGTATVTVNVSGGKSPYSYSLNGFYYQSGNTFSNVYPGNYTVYVWDANFCFAYDYVTVTQPSYPLSISLLRKSNVTCRGGSDGYIQVSSSGGASPYTYSLNNGAYTSSNSFSGLKAGTYTVKVKDAKGCTNSLTTTVYDGYWYCITGTQSSSSISNKIDINAPLQIKVSPNPSLDEFKLKIESGNTENIEIIITDIFGRKVLQAKGSANQTYTVGHNFASGVYMLQVLQGKNVQTLKLIKGN